MKKLLVLLSMCLLTVIVSAAMFAQVDTTLSLTSVSGQVSSVIQATTGHNLTYNILFLAAIAGVLTRIVYSTVKGVKSKFNGSPLQFAWSYWIKDNALPKIVTTLSFILSFSLLSNLPSGLIAYLIYGAIGFILGLFLDWITDILKSISPKVKTA
jgi:hypothetical protein